jgi:hypothetical protein
MSAVSTIEVFIPIGGTALAGTGKARNIRRRLGASGNTLVGPFPAKPSKMRWATYKRLRSIDAALLEQWFLGMAVDLRRLRRRVKRHRLQEYVVHLDGLRHHVGPVWTLQELHRAQAELSGVAGEMRDRALVALLLKRPFVTHESQRILSKSAFAPATGYRPAA